MFWVLISISSNSLIVCFCAILSSLFQSECKRQALPCFSLREDQSLFCPLIHIHWSLNLCLSHFIILSSPQKSDKNIPGKGHQALLPSLSACLRLRGYPSCCINPPSRSYLLARLTEQDNAEFKIHISQELATNLLSAVGSAGQDLARLVFTSNGEIIKSCGRAVWSGRGWGGGGIGVLDVWVFLCVCMSVWASLVCEGAFDWH